MNNVTYYENYCSNLTQKGKSYRVQNLWDDQTVYIEECLTSMISEEAKEDPYLIAIILALIKIRRTEGTVRTAVRKTRGTSTDKPSDSVLLNSIADILSKYSAVEVIDVIKDMKWHDLKKIINSNTALEDYVQYINS